MTYPPYGEIGLRSFFWSSRYGSVGLPGGRGCPGPVGLPITASINPDPDIGLAPSGGITFPGGGLYEGAPVVACDAGGFALTTTASAVGCNTCPSVSALTKP
ncbi:MAG: hypothetical protein AAB262_06420 [Elusimicrobiota bacterium]